MNNDKIRDAIKAAIRSSLAPMKTGIRAGEIFMRMGPPTYVKSSEK